MQPCEQILASLTELVVVRSHRAHLILQPRRLLQDIRKDPALCFDFDGMGVNGGTQAEEGDLDSGHPVGRSGGPRCGNLEVGHGLTKLDSPGARPYETWLVGDCRLDGRGSRSLLCAHGSTVPETSRWCLGSLCPTDSGAGLAGLCTSRAASVAL